MPYSEGWWLGWMVALGHGGHDDQAWNCWTWETRVGLSSFFLQLSLLRPDSLRLLLLVWKRISALPIVLFSFVLLVILVYSEGVLPVHSPLSCPLSGNLCSWMSLLGSCTSVSHFGDHLAHIVMRNCVGPCHCNVRKYLHTVVSLAILVPLYWDSRLIASFWVHL